MEVKAVNSGMLRKKALEVIAQERGIHFKDEVLIVTNPLLEKFLGIKRFCGGSAPNGFCIIDCVNDVWVYIDNGKIFSGIIGKDQIPPPSRDNSGNWECRTHQWHSCEHRLINLLENGIEVTPENLRTVSDLSPRCGSENIVVDPPDEYLALTLEVAKEYHKILKTVK